MSEKRLSMKSDLTKDYISVFELFLIVLSFKSKRYMYICN